MRPFTSDRTSAGSFFFCFVFFTDTGVLPVVRLAEILKPSHVTLRPGKCCLKARAAQRRSSLAVWRG